jgi:predicted phage terminase large subunit-like protein
MVALTDEVFDALAAKLGPLRLPRAYCPVEPTVKQEWYLRRDELEAFFGGAAGPGKSWGLLMAGLQYVDVEGYHGLLLRPTLGEFEQAGGLIEWSHDWLDGSDAWWNGTKRTWYFPSKATLRFGYLANEGDLSQYKGPSYSFCGFDELTSFTERLYRGMFRILRQAKGTLEGVPLRMRSASNPGDIGHAWVKARFIEPKTREPGAVFVPAWITDNPHMDYAAYLQSLAHMSPIDRQRLIDGDWDVTEEGGKFKRGDFRIVDPADVEPAVNTIRYWDLAGSEPSDAYPDPDWTVGLLYERAASGTFTIRDVIRGRWQDDRVQATVRRAAEEDGKAVTVYIEQDPGQAGKAQLNHYKRHVLAGYSCYSGMTKLGGKSAAKEVRARPAAAAAANGLIQIVADCPNLREFLDEVSIFPNGSHDDCVDALSGAHNAVTGRSNKTGRTSVPTGRIPGVDGRDRAAAVSRR